MNNKDNKVGEVEGMQRSNLRPDCKYLRMKIMGKVRVKLIVNQIEVLQGKLRYLFAATLIVILLQASSAYAANIVQIALSSEDIPFLLDDEGYVWAFRDPLHVEKPIKIPGLNNIKVIAPYIALDVNGDVFTWSLNLNDSVSDQGELSEAVYNLPEKIIGVHKFTMISAENWFQFSALNSANEIVTWSAILDKSGTTINGSLSTVSTKRGVKKLVMLGANLVAWFDDGAVTRWEIKPSESRKESTSFAILQLKNIDAQEVAASSTHTVILTKNGLVLFWGGCDFNGKDRQGKSWSLGRVEGALGFIDDVIGMGINSGNDNVAPDIFIKRDGSLWAAYAPLPIGVSGRDCYRSAGEKRQYWQLTAGNSAAVQVAVANSILMLDAEHKLWTTAGSWMNTKLRNISINTNNIDSSGFPVGR